MLEFCISVRYPDISTYHINVLATYVCAEFVCVCNYQGNVFEHDVNSFEIQIPDLISHNLILYFEI